MTARDAFLKTFAKVTGTGDFHSAGSAPFFFPGIEVTGLGELAFPLPASQVREIVELAEVAPYGLGERTVLDENVRRCWQLDAAHISFHSTAWQTFLERTLVQVRKDLGITGKISATPYKLLIYGPGGHFRAHRDTEKLDSMFGTLILALPSAHQGGRLLIRHNGREAEVDFSRETHAFQHAALFADCEHEVEPVVSGFRCCLVYNLRLEGGDPKSLNLSLTSQARTLLSPLQKLQSERVGELTAVLLEHSYTEANLSLRNLKGHDQSRARALLAAARESAFVAHLALVTFHQTGELEDGYGYGRRGRYDDDDPSNDGTMGEVYEENLSIGNWRNSDDRSVALGEYSIHPEALINGEKFGRGDPDEKEAEGFTGNAGCTMDYWYRRAAIVLWSGDDHEQILCRYNFRGACASFSSLAASRDSGPAFHRLGEALVAQYHGCPTTGIHPSTLRDSGDHPFRLILGAIARAGSHALLARFLAKINVEHFVLCDEGLWRKLFRAFGFETFEGVGEDLVNGGLEENRRALFQFLDAILTCRDASAWAAAIAGQLSSLAPAEPAPSWSLEGRCESQAPGDREETRILLAASHHLEPADRRAAADFLRADSSLAYIREILGPSLLEDSVKKRLRIQNSLVSEILAFAKKLLAEEIARPLNPFPDWTRPCPPRAAHASALIGELLAFMADPAAKDHRFVRSQGDRTALEDFIRRHALDLDCITITKGRPYTLACTKNDKSHQHAIARRTQDQALLARLEA